jgi:hypothetical protein
MEQHETSSMDAHIRLAVDHPEGCDRYSPMVLRPLHLMIIDILATCVALRIGGGRLQPMLCEMKNNLRAKCDTRAISKPDRHESIVKWSLSATKTEVKAGWKRPGFPPSCVAVEPVIGPTALRSGLLPPHGRRF